MKRNTKITIAALCTMFVMAIAVSVLAFSYASREDGKATITDASEIVFADGSLADTYTNIDNIIANSYATGTDADPVYHIVEISSSGVSCGLEQYVNDGRFEELVLNSYSTQLDKDKVLKKMKAGNVDYKLLAPSDLENGSADLATIAKADLIYVSNDASVEFSSDNDLGENAYDLLKSYSVGNFKPIIIDAPKATTSQEGEEAKQYLVTTLVDKYFDPMGYSRYTFAWNKATQSVEQFFNHKNGSMYLGIHGDTRDSANAWTTIYDNKDLTAEGVKSYKVSKVLSVSTSDKTDNAMALLGGSSLIDTATTKYYDDKGAEIKATNIYDITGTLFQTKGYNNRYVIPDYVQLETINLSDIDATTDLDQYDMIVFEDSCKGCVITKECYTKFVDAFYGSKSIVYPSDFSGAKATDDLTSDLGMGNSNFVDLYELLVTKKGEAKYSNVLNTTRSTMSEIFASTNKGTAKVVVDLINASTYRGIGGSGTGSSSSMFTVLEIQPCYPIDRELAAKEGAKYDRGYQHIFIGTTNDKDKGNYYIYPRDVINGKTKEQIQEESEYYAWELSKAKIADAFGLDVKQVNLIQMSSSELASSKREIYGNVDLVYIGGNNSAMTTASERRGYAALYSQLANNAFSNYLKGSLDRLAALPIYDLYTHTGDMVPLKLGDGKSNQGQQPFGQVKQEEIGLSKNTWINTFTVLNGNDISYRNYEDLKKYVDAGLPVVVSNKVSCAYDIYKSKNNKQNSLDPQSNMVRFLNACDSKLNVMWKFEEDAVVDRDNDGGRLGDTLTGYVSVFAPSTGATSDSEEAHDTDPADGEERDSVTHKKIVRGNIDNLVALCANREVTKTRPKLTVTSMPVTYNLYDETTKLTNRNLSFKYRVSGTTNYSVKLYIDDDGNSKFDRSEEGVASGDKNELKYKVADSFSGPLYWMLEVVDNSTGLSAYTTGIAYIKNDENNKQIVRILQIMPGEANRNTVKGGNSFTATGEGNGSNTLYFCKDCQKSLERLDYNYVSGEPGLPRNHYETLYDGKYSDTERGQYGKVNLGIHQHRFGIAPFDSSIPFRYNGIYNGSDNWEKNLADDLNKMYEFDIDILLRGEFEAYANEINKAYDVSGMSEADKKDKVSKYNIDMTTDEGKEFAALTLDEQVQYILKDEYKQEADKYNQWYKLMLNDELESTEQFVYDMKPITITSKQAKEKFLKDMEVLISNNSSEQAKVYDESFNQTFVPIEQEIRSVLRDGAYSDLFSISRKNGNMADMRLNDGSNDTLADIYNTYIETKDVEVKLQNEYKKYSRLAAGHDWLSECYDMVLIGPSEDFAGDDIKDVTALADLKDYVDKDGNVLFFHDTLSTFTDKGTSSLTAAMKESFGVDRYHMEIDKTANPQSGYVKYKVKDGYDKEKYFMSNISPLDVSDPDRYSKFNYAVNSAFTGDNNPNPYWQWYLSDVGYTDYALILGDSIHYNVNPYRYTEAKWAVAANKDQQDAKFNQITNTNYGTNAASQNNVGIVTMYPFTLGSELSISPTHSQSYAVDIEDDDLTVWYSFAGGYNDKVRNKDSNSSMYAADPRDGMNNYFIYSKGNITYCGAGHAKVTGSAKENNDERKLYINIICNSVRKSVKQPTINIYDFGKDTCGDKIKLSEDGQYFTKVENVDEYTDFNFKVTCDPTATLTNVRIYYDLDYSESNPSSAYVKDENHKLIANWNSKDNPDRVKSGLNVPVFRYDDKLLPRYDKDGHEIEVEYFDGTTKKKTRESMLQLQPEYFEKYDGYHTYIVIEATDSKGNKVYQRLKIQLKETLFNLT